MFAGPAGSGTLHRSQALGRAACHVRFERSARFLPEETVATAILDRLLHHCHVIPLAGESFHLREARQVLAPA